MDEAERRFRACTDRFKRDLTKMILRSIDSMVRDGQRTLAKEEALRKKAAAQAAREARAAERAAEKAARAEARKAERAAAQALKLEQRALKLEQRALELEQKALARMANGAGQQMELQLGLSELRPGRQRSRPRMRADSILGAELADVGNAVAPEGSNASSALAGPVPLKQPSERPLFVHKRARDGQIHALRRVRENATSEPNSERDSLESTPNPR